LETPKYYHPYLGKISNLDVAHGVGGKKLFKWPHCKDDTQIDMPTPEGRGWVLPKHLLGWNLMDGTSFRSWLNWCKTLRGAGLAAAPAPALAASPASKDKEPKEKKEKVVKEKPTWGEPGKGHSLVALRKGGAIVCMFVVP